MPRQRSLDVRITEAEEVLQRMKLQQKIKELQDKLPKRKKRVRRAQ